MQRKTAIVPEASKKTILLVDDEAIIAIHEARILESRGYDVLKVFSGEKAVEATKNGKIDLILMDIDLGTNGIDGTEAAQAILRSRDLPIIFLTSHSEKEMVDRVKGITRYGYVLKNTGEFVLIESINMAFELFSAHQKTKESELKYRAAFMTSPDAVTISTLEGGYVEINDVFTKLTGYSREETIGKTTSDLNIWHNPSDRERLINGLQDKGYVKDMEVEFSLKDGSVGKGLISARTIKIAGVPHIIAITREVSERRKPDEMSGDTAPGSGERCKEEFELKGSPSQTLFEYSETAFFILGTDDRILDANRTACEMMGYTREELLSLGISDIQAPETREEEGRIIKNELEKHGECFFKGLNIRKDGTRIPVEIKNTFIDSADGGYIISAVHPFTHGDESWKAVATDTEKYKGLFEAAPYGIIILNLTGSILDVNQAFLDMTGGYEYKDFVGKPFLKIPTLIGQSIGTYINLFTSIVSGNNTSTLLLDWKHKTGERRTCEARYRLIRGTGKEPAVIQATLRDVTEDNNINFFLKVTNTRLTSILDSIPAEICIFDPYSFRILFMNANMQKAFGGNFTDKNYHDLCRDTGRPLPPWAPPSPAQQEGDTDTWEYYNPVDKECRLYSSRFLTWTDGSIVRLQIAMDISRQKHQEELLKKTLEEKNFLMKELNHRVKNHLLMVTSLINLKERELGPEVSLSDLKYRIDAIRILHEMLQKQENLSHIRFKPYISELLDALFTSSSPYQAEYTLDAVDVTFPTDTAIPLGLIVNEIATNALKHGIIPGKKLLFTVRLKKTGSDNRFHLTLGNSGAPLPETFHLEDNGSLGLRLISSLVQQLEGTIEIDREPSPVFTIQFPEDTDP